MQKINENGRFEVFWVKLGTLQGDKNFAVRSVLKSLPDKLYAPVLFGFEGAEKNLPVVQKILRSGDDLYCSLSPNPSITVCAMSNRRSL